MEDATMATVLKTLDSLGAQVLFLDQHKMLGLELLATDLELDLSCGVRTTFMQSGRRTDLSRVRAGYLRPYDARAFPVPAKAGPGSEIWRHALALDGALWARLILRPSASLIGPGTWRPTAPSHSSHSKSMEPAFRFLKR
jgi:hypothetical protein